MIFSVSEQVTEIFPKITIGIVRGAGSSPFTCSDEKIQEMRSAAESELGEKGLQTSTLSTHPHMQAWRDAYRKFKVKAKTHKPTHEALARRILVGDGWPDINPIVDIYLTNQLCHLLPHGGYDADKLSGTLRLEISSGDEPFTALGGEEQMTKADEVIYRDDQRILTRRWNYRDADATCIRDETTNFILMIESPGELIDDEAVAKSADDLAGRYRSVFDGDFSSEVIRITPDNRELEI